MNDISQRLFDLARRNAATYAEYPKVRAIMLVGSVSRGIADRYSDIDTIMFCSEHLTQEERAEAMARNNGSDLFRLGGPEGGMDQYLVEGTQCQFGMGLVDECREELAAVIERFETDHDHHVIMGGLAHAIPLHGAPIIEQWKATAATYPEGLRRAMVARHLTFRPIWFLKERLAGRDDYFQFREALAIAGRNIIGVLLGLNRLYPEHNFKRLSDLIGRMTIAPPDLSLRLHTALERPPTEALTEFERMIEETFELVERSLPDFDTSEARAKYLKQPEG